MSACCATPFPPAAPCARGTFPATPGDVTASLDVAELLRRAARGDPAAWDEIVGRYSGLVSAKIRTFRLQDADALDAM